MSWVGEGILGRGQREHGLESKFERQNSNNSKGNKGAVRIVHFPQLGRVSTLIRLYF